MLVKKIDPEWVPSEKKDLLVGETIEITNPRQLITEGKVVAIGSSGEEISAYDLYGVVIASEKKEFEAFLKIRQAESLKKTLEKEQEVLVQKKNTLDTVEKQKMNPYGLVVSMADASTPVVIPEVNEKTSWDELIKKGSDLGVYKVGMKKADLIVAINTL